MADNFGWKLENTIILIEFQQLAAKIDGVLFVEVSAPKNIHKDFECLVISTPEAV